MSSCKEDSSNQLTAAQNSKSGDRSQFASDSIDTSTKIETVYDEGEVDVNTTTPLNSGECQSQWKRSAWYNALYPNYKMRCQEMKKFFGHMLPESERLVVDYSCALQRDILVQGRMYVTTSYICFYASIFSWETNIVIAFKDVSTMSKEKTALVIPNAMLICTNSSEKFFFASFTQRDKSFALLYRFWRNLVDDQNMSCGEKWRLIHESYGDELGLTSEDDMDYIPPHHLRSQHHQTIIPKQKSITKSNSKSSRRGFKKRKKLDEHRKMEGKQFSSSLSTTSSGVHSSVVGSLVASSIDASIGENDPSIGIVEKKGLLVRHGKILEDSESTNHNGSSSKLVSSSYGSGSSEDISSREISISNFEYQRDEPSSDVKSVEQFSSNNNFEGKNNSDGCELVLSGIDMKQNEIELYVRKWNSFVSDVTKEGSRRQIVNHTFSNLNVDLLFNLLFTNSTFISNFHKMRKTLDVCQSQWHSLNDQQLVLTKDKKFSHSLLQGDMLRNLSFTLSLNHPMGPKHAYTTEKQVLKCDLSRSGSIYVIECRTDNAGIPYGDSFYVTTHFCIHRETEGVEGKSRLLIFSDIQYAKSLWGIAKALIEKNTWAGIEDHFCALKKSLESFDEEHYLRMSGKNNDEIDDLNDTINDGQQQHSQEMKKGESGLKLKRRKKSMNVRQTKSTHHPSLSIHSTYGLRRRKKKFDSQFNETLDSTEMTDSVGEENRSYFRRLINFFSHSLNLNGRCYEHHHNTSCRRISQRQQSNSVVLLSLIIGILIILLLTNIILLYHFLTLTSIIAASSNHNEMNANTFQNTDEMKHFAKFITQFTQLMNTYAIQNHSLHSLNNLEKT